MSGERTESFDSERPVAPVGEEFRPFSDWKFVKIDGSKVLRPATVEHAIEGQTQLIIATSVGTPYPIGNLIDTGSISQIYTIEGKCITPEGLVDSSGNRKLAIEVLKKYPYVLTVYLRRFASKEIPQINVDVNMEADDKKIVAQAKFGRGSGFYIGKEIANFTKDSIGFSFPGYSGEYQVILPQDPDYLQNKFSLKLSQEEN